MSVYQSIKLSQIDIPEDRIREVDQDWAECLRDMFKEMGQKTPIDVVENDKRYSLVAGAQQMTNMGPREVSQLADQDCCKEDSRRLAQLQLVENAEGRQ
ncbi:hypothetical protein LP7551_00361 [Roseibium album]|nr:hypothetical protein LP7551_00361 [Roseibium album]